MTSTYVGENKHVVFKSVLYIDDNAKFILVGYKYAGLDRKVTIGFLLHSPVQRFCWETLVQFMKNTGHILIAKHQRYTGNHAVAAVLWGPFGLDYQKFLHNHDQH